MTSLSRLQALFRQAVTAEAGEAAHEFLGEVAPDGRIGPEKRLHIYAHAYQARLRETLQKDYPVLQSMLGEAAFGTLCDAYARAHPSRHPSLRFYGQHLSAFLRKEPPYRNLPALAEMAAFEWGFVNVFDAPDASAVCVEDVARIPPPAWTTLRLGFHPSLSLQQTKWNVTAIWSSVSREEQPVLPQELAAPVIVIQWRRDLVSYFRTLDPDEAEVLPLALRQESFPVLCEQLFREQGEQAPLRAAELLKRWVSEGLVVALDYADVATPH
ncbi:DNA-binding domain-containing protein [Luteithermobacter gelatinilyticus]|uniref:HvfC/BufC N-terminal domain-containing protein n=1 Tax=Luteithermobacter gelatinilyticus TaxID=2582913 RepID=UPI001105B505|nr:DNA-binding domain-containing protein [Luteithermobacter gelatinilyticus]